MEDKKKEAIIDKDYPLDHVPISARVGLISVFAVLLGFVFCSPVMIVGSQVGAAFRFWPFVGVLLIGNLVLGLYVALISGIGAKTGLTTVLQSRYTLGTIGAKWADLILGGTQIGWYGVNNAVLAMLFAQGFGLQEYTVPLMIFWGLVVGITAYVGYKGLEILSFISVPLVIIMGLWVTFRAFSDGGGYARIVQIEPVSTMSVATAITVLVGVFVSGGTQAANWARFAKTPKIGFWAGLTAFLFGNALMVFFGGIGALVYKEGDFVLVLYKMGLILAGVLFLTLNMWTTNDNTAYAFGVAGSEFFGGRSKKPFVVGGVLIGTALSVTGIYGALIPWLLFLGIFIPPVGGVILGDYYFFWKQKLPKFGYVSFPKVRWPNVVSYVLGTLAAYFGQTTGIGIPPINGIVVAAAAVPFMEYLFSSVRSLHGVYETPKVSDGAEYV